MELNHYQRESRKTALYPDVGSNAIYPTLGLVGEAGEVADKVKKILRDKNGLFDEKSKDEIIFELGDVLWYISQLASELGYELDDVANSNLQKLKSRKLRGKIQGSGDDRWSSYQYTWNPLMANEAAFPRIPCTTRITTKARIGDKSKPPNGGIIPLKKFK